MTNSTEDFSGLSRYFTVQNNPEKILYNNFPVSDFMGLTPSEMFDLIYQPFKDGSDFEFISAHDEVLDQIPFFLLVEHLLLMIYRDNSSKLTPRGCLSTKYCIELLEQKFIKDTFFEGKIRKRILEEYFPSIEVSRLILQLNKLVIKKNNSLKLSKSALLLLQEKRRFELFKKIFETYTHLFSWAYLDGYKNEMVGQLGFAFSLTLLKQYGNASHKVSFYFDLYKRAFPQLASHFQDYPYFPAEKQFIACYRTRLFDRFFEWFGLVKQDNNSVDNMNPGNNMYTKTEIVDKLFKTPEISNNFI